MPQHELTEGQATSGDVTAEELREIVSSDKALASEVIREARDHISSFRTMGLLPDITGKPDEVAEFNRYKRDQLRNLENVSRTPFFLRVKTDFTQKGETERKHILLTQARNVSAAVFGDSWILTSWTSPLGLAIRGKTPGDRVIIPGSPASRSFPKAPARPEAVYDTLGTATYAELLPRLANAEFLLDDGRHAGVVSEDDLDQLLAQTAASPQLPPKEYQTKPTFGLNDIIILVDEPQNAALALPFRQSAIIEGPPGSGKTSIGIMRIAVLYDQQWEVLGLRQERDRPFHDYSTMRVLVYNDEMVEYLRSLANSIHVDHVQVSTTRDFFRRICRETRLLSGTERRDKSSLAILKGRPEALCAYFAGFKSHLRRYWEKHQGDVRQRLFDLGPDFLIIADRLSRWVDRVQTAEVVDDQISGIGVADDITDAAETIRRGASPTRLAKSPAETKVPAGDGQRTALNPEVVKERLSDARKLVETTLKSACSRAGITRAMFETPEFDALKSTAGRSGVPSRVIEDGERLWRRQYAGDLPAYSELDLAMSAWLGARLLLSARDNPKPWIGGRLERLTHIVVDEAQDLSPSHLAVLASQLVPDGTMTLVGDIHQNLNPHAGLRRWDDAHLANAVMSAFAVNHRQTRQLGEFMQGLHSALFDERCPWRPSEKTLGPLPRARTARSWTELASAIGEEARYWREAISGQTGATVAVLYDGVIKPKRLRWLQKSLELALSDQLVPVEVAMPDAGGEPLRRTDRIVIASVRQTKGLEFDAVVFVEPRPRWSKPLDDIDLRIRNGFYVATSRARAGLSLCMSNLPECIDDLAKSGLCDFTTAPSPADES